MLKAVTDFGAAPMAEPKHDDRRPEDFPPAPGGSVPARADAPTARFSPGSFPQRASTVGWAPLVAAADPATRPAPTQAGPAASTPGPHAPERGTHAESTAQSAQQRAAERGAQPQFPPIPGYEIRRFVARGGMGMVYEAVQLATGRTVALKLVNPVGAQDRVTQERFAREVRALAALKHPNIVPVYDAGDWHGFPYYAMEFVAGGTLSHHIERVRADLRGAVRLMAKATRAVAAMHAAGVLHRDLKPLNILLGANDEPMVADLGLARWADDESDLTNSGLPVGTRQYMAPEQTHGRRTDYTPACDVWALGVTLYEVLTGRRPFSDDGDTDVYVRIRSEEPPPIASLAGGVPAELEAVVLTCLAKRPEDRYASAAALADDLERWLAGAPVLAPQAPAPAPAAPLAPSPAEPRHRARAFVASATVVLLAVVLAGASGVFGGAPVPKPAPPKKTLAERVAAGEKVKLTDDKGVPTVPWSLTKGHELTEKALGDFHGFASTGVGLADLADEAWGRPIRIEADVTVGYDTDPNTAAGVYVGRRRWDGLAFTHESLVWFGVGPRLDGGPPKKRELACLTGLYWWNHDRHRTSSIFEEKRAPWHHVGDADQRRLARVVIEVRENEICGTVDGELLKPVGETPARAELARIVADRPRFPQYTFTPSAFGTGIGVFCRHADCAVLNLTVSKLDP